MEPIVYIDRVTGKKEIEKVYGASGLKLLYGEDFRSRFFGKFLLFFAKTSFFGALFGLWNKLPLSKKKVKPFIESYRVDASEFADPVESYSSFNDFFIRKLKPESRPIAPGKNVAIIPADGRFLFYQNIETSDGFIVKGKKFDLTALLQDAQLAQKFSGGSMVLGRLCPTDYHRFHFPCDCVPTKAHLINGWLYSVNPIALKKNVDILTQNKRMVTLLNDTPFGTIAFLEVGATCVGSIHETYAPNVFQPKGAEKGYFSFGGSALVILFEPNSIQFDQDLLNATLQGLEIRCLFGQTMGKG